MTKKSRWPRAHRRQNLENGSLGYDSLRPPQPYWLRSLLFGDLNTTVLSFLPAFFQIQYLFFCSYWFLWEELAHGQLSLRVSADFSLRLRTLNCSRKPTSLQSNRKIPSLLSHSYYIAHFTLCLNPSSYFPHKGRVSSTVRAACTWVSRHTTFRDSVWVHQPVLSSPRWLFHTICKILSCMVTSKLFTVHFSVP